MRRRVKSVLFILFLACLASPSFASIIKKPPVKTVEQSYDDLACTAEQKGYIRELIVTMAENNKLTLLFRQTHLKGIGDLISDVHPLKFLETVFADPALKVHMLSIWNDYFKRNGFMEGLGPSLDREVEKGKLHVHINEFGNRVGVPGEQLKVHFDERNWENLVLFLIQS